VAEPDVPSDNNPAERSLRHVVISRKISGGTRSERGTESKMTLASVFGTWRARGLNPLAACRQLLTSPKSELLPGKDSANYPLIEYDAETCLAIHAVISQTNPTEHSP
jgi:hypothetical protein